MDSRPRNSPAEMQRWIDQSQGIVRSIATRIHNGLPKSVQYDDLVAYGQLGLVQAAHSFDPDKNVTFQTFAYHRIRGAMYDGLAKMAWSNRALEARLRAERMSAELLDQQVQAWHDERANIAEDADWLVQTTERIAVIHLLSDSADGSSLSAVDPQLQPAEAVEHEELKKLVRSLLHELDAEEQAIIELFYFEGKTLTEIANTFEKSKSWASRNHSRILEVLARRLSAAGVN